MERKAVKELLYEEKQFFDSENGGTRAQTEGTMIKNVLLSFIVSIAPLFSFSETGRQLSRETAPLWTFM
jgi:hypothetical protein